MLTSWIPYFTIVGSTSQHPIFINTFLLSASVITVIPEGATLTFDIVPWWSMALSTFSYVYWIVLYLLWRNVLLKFFSPFKKLNCLFTSEFLYSGYNSLLMHPLCSIAHSCPTLCDPMDCSLPGSSVHGILQARILERVAIFSSRGIFPTQGSNMCLWHWQVGSLPLRHLGSPLAWLLSSYGTLDVSL